MKNITSPYLGRREDSKGENVRKKTHQEFVDEVYKLVGDEYIVLGEYKSDKIKILMKHNKCGREYLVTPHSFLSSCRCFKCQIKKIHIKQKKTIEQFRQEVYNLVSAEYNILSKEYEGTDTKILMKHELCKYEWYVTPHSFLRRHGCPKCRGKIIASKLRKSLEQFKFEVFELVKSEYEIVGEYINSRTKIIIKHNKCGNEFESSPNNFLKGTRCPHCNNFKGPKQIKEFLKGNNINFTFEYGINDCRNKRPLPFDFAIFYDKEKTQLNCLIEYDGIMHFKITDIGNNLDYQIKNDQIKTQYCKDNNIKLIRIPYTEFDNIERILIKEL